MNAFVSSLAAFLHLKQRSPRLSGWQIYFLVTTILLAETAALSFLKEYSISHNVVALTAGLICYILVPLFLVRSYRYEGMGIVNVLWSAFSVMFVVGTGVILFGEKLTMPEVWGTLFVVAGVVVLRLPAKKSSQSAAQCLHLIDDLPPLP